MKRLEELGQAIARAQDAELARRGPIVLRLPLPLPLVRRSAWPVRFAAAAVLTLVAAGAGLWRTAHRSLSMDGPALGEWVEASAADRAVTFSDGSTLLFAAGTRFQITALTRVGADVVIDHGRVAVSVAHHEGTRWLFHTGPFETEVVGTRFDLKWQGAEQTFELVMLDGLVNVRGPSLPAARKVVAGERLTFDLRPVAPAPVVAAPAPTPRPSSPAWRALAQRGQYVEALAAARKSGFERLCEQVPAIDGQQLGDVARLAGDIDRARLAYQLVRERFPGSREASAASFELGRLAFDGDDDAAAISWFEACLSEAPEGPFARDAQGRLMEAQQRSGDRISARATAGHYLQAWPLGPHGGLARSLLGR